MDSCTALLFTVACLVVGIGYVIYLIVTNPLLSLFLVIFITILVYFVYLIARSQKEKESHIVKTQILATHRENRTHTLSTSYFVKTTFMIYYDDGTHVAQSVQNGTGRYHRLMSKLEKEYGEDPEPSNTNKQIVKTKILQSYSEGTIRLLSEDSHAKMTTFMVYYDDGTQEAKSVINAGAEYDSFMSKLEL